MSKLVALLVAASLAIAALLAGQLTGLITLNFGSRTDAHRYKNSGMLEVVCDAEISRPGDNLEPPFETSRLTLPVRIDFDESTGAYPGEYTISMNRKGTVHVKDALIEIHRPAMFKRHGAVIVGEFLTLDRKSGELKQWLELDNGKKLLLITGSCKRADNAPF